MQNDLSRRQFIERAGLVAAGALTTGLRTGRAGEAPQAAPRAPASERIQLGFIGVGGRGREILAECASFSDVDIVMIADVHDVQQQRALETAQAKGHQPQTCRDFRHLLDNRDIDAVVIGSPDHWHGLHTIHSCRAGKDVYVEKPLSHNVREGQAMVDAARRANRVTQLGTQIHAGENYRRVVEIVQSGMLGEIVKSRAWVARNEADLGSPPDCPPPADCDYDMWLGPAPLRPFNPVRFHNTFRYFWDYAGGTMVDMACHTLDLVYWALDLDTPRTVTASGGRYSLRDMGETPDTQEVVWEFPAAGEAKTPLQVVYSQSEGNAHGISGRSVGIAFYGRNATLISDYSGYEIISEGERMRGRERPEPSIPPSPGHAREFLDCVKTRSRCSCDIEYAHRLTTAPLIASIAYRTGMKLTWDGARQEFVGAPEANRLLQREYRVPYTLPA